MAEAHLQIKGLVRLQYRGLVRLQYGGLVQYREVLERLRAARTSAAAYRFSQSFAHMRVSLTKLTN